MNEILQSTPSTKRYPIIKVPQEMTRPDIVQTILMIFKHLCTFSVPLLILVFIFQSFGLTIWTAVPAILLSLLSSFGLHSLGLMGHEGTHFSLHSNRYVSAYIGVVTSSLVPFHMDMGFAIRHNQHHRFTNTNKDPDIVVFDKFRGLWSRLFLARLEASREYMTTTWTLASGAFPEEWNSMLNLTRAQITFLARSNMIWSLIFLAGYIILGYNLPGFALAFGLTFVWTVMVSGLRPYLEHAGTDSGRFTSSRSWISPVFNYLYSGINYHLAHHLAPAVPAYRIKEFHEWLATNGYFNGETVVEINSLSDVLPILREQAYGRH